MSAAIWLSITPNTRRILSCRICFLRPFMSFLATRGPSNVLQLSKVHGC